MFWGVVKGRFEGKRQAVREGARRGVVRVCGVLAVSCLYGDCMVPVVKLRKDCGVAVG